MTDRLDIVSLQERASRLRCDVLNMVTTAKSGHIGGSFSAAEIVTYLYFHLLRLDPLRPDWEDRDRFILSKGHCAPIVYAALAEKGYFSRDVLWTLRDIHSILQGHPDMKKTPGIDMTTGSLGQGLSCAVGMALAARLQGRAFRVFTVLGDGELQCGQVWEAVMAAAHHHLDNLIAVVDDNGVQADGLTAETVAVEPIAAHFRSFGWDANEIDGHDFAQIHRAFRRAARRDGRPKAIVARTVKGRGVSFMEGCVSWHSGAPDPEQARAALAELLAGGDHD